MNPLTQFKKTPILPLLIALALVVAGLARAAISDFNANRYVLQNASTRQTAIWYLNNNVFVRGAYGPTLPTGWGVAGVADFNGDGHADYALFNPATRQTAIWYLNNNVRIGSAWGPTITSGYALIGAADFNGDGKPDYVLQNTSTRQTTIWYLNNNVFVSGAFGPTVPAGWSLVEVEGVCESCGYWDY